MQTTIDRVREGAVPAPVHVPTSEAAAEVARLYRRARIAYGDAPIDMDATHVTTVGGVCRACAAGWAARLDAEEDGDEIEWADAVDGIRLEPDERVALRPGTAETLGFRAGTALVARTLGFGDEHAVAACEAWAGAHPEIWGGPHGDELFSDRAAYEHAADPDGELRLSHLERQWWEVHSRLHERECATRSAHWRARERAGDFDVPHAPPARRALVRATDALVRYAEECAAARAVPPAIEPCPLDALELGRRLEQTVAAAVVGATAEERAALNGLGARAAGVVRDLHPDPVGSELDRAAIDELTAALAMAVCTVVATRDRRAIEGGLDAVTEAVRTWLGHLANGGPVTTLEVRLELRLPRPREPNDLTLTQRQRALDALRRRATALGVLAAARPCSPGTIVTPSQWLDERHLADALRGVGHAAAERVSDAVGALTPCPPLDHAGVDAIERAIAEAAHLGLDDEVRTGCDAIARVVVADARVTQDVDIEGGPDAVAALLAEHAGRQPLSGKIT